VNAYLRATNPALPPLAYLESCRIALRYPALLGTEFGGLLSQVSMMRQSVERLMAGDHDGS